MYRCALGLLCLAAFAPLVSAAPKAPQAIPDFSGTWERIGERSVIVDDKGGTSPQYLGTAAQQARLKPQYQKEKEARMKAASEADARGVPIVGRTAQCQGNGMPYMMGGPFPIEVLQGKDQVTIIQEIYTQVRRIYIGKPQKKLEELEPGFYGRSVGHWDKGALLVDTIGIKAAWNMFMPNSGDIHIKEKIYFADKDMLRDEITVEDPGVLEQPYSYTLNYRRLPGYEMLEYVCEDNHYYVDEGGKQATRPESSAR